MPKRRNEEWPTVVVWMLHLVSQVMATGVAASLLTERKVVTHPHVVQRRSHKEAVPIVLPVGGETMVPPVGEMMDPPVGGEMMVPPVGGEMMVQEAGGRTTGETTIMIVT